MIMIAVTVAIVVMRITGVMIVAMTRLVAIAVVVVTAVAVAWLVVMTIAVAWLVANMVTVMPLVMVIMVAVDAPQSGVPGAIVMIFAVARIMPGIQAGRQSGVALCDAGATFSMRKRRGRRHQTH